MMNQKNLNFESFKKFYPYYLNEHRTRACKVSHFIGTTLIFLTLAVVYLTGYWVGLYALPLFGYGFAWIGHFIFEKNRPATFRFPLYSLAGDFKMYGQLLTGKLPFRTVPPGRSHFN